jgi:hypothetical protein
MTVSSGRHVSIGRHQPGSRAGLRAGGDQSTCVPQLVHPEWPKMVGLENMVSRSVCPEWPIRGGYGTRVVCPRTHGLRKVCPEGVVPRTHGSVVCPPGCAYRHHSGGCVPRMGHPSAYGVALGVCLRTHAYSGGPLGVAYMLALTPGGRQGSVYHTPCWWRKVTQMGHMCVVLVYTTWRKTTHFAVYSAPVAPACAASAKPVRWIQSSSRMEGDADVRLAQLTSARRRRRWRWRWWRRRVTEAHTQKFFVSSFRQWVNILLAGGVK